MAEGGFLMKFDGKEAKRGYAVPFDCDAWNFTLKKDDPRPIPKGVKEITVLVGRS
jgi:hypothetical protein